MANRLTCDVSGSRQRFVSLSKSLFCFTFFVSAQRQYADHLSVNWITLDNRRCCRHSDSSGSLVTACPLEGCAGRLLRRVRELLSL